MFRSAVTGALAAILALSTPAAAEDGAQLAARFGALDSVYAPSLSPDGSKLIFLSPTMDGGRVLFLADLVAGGLPKSVIGASGDRGDVLDWCRFATETRIVCQMSKTMSDAGTLVGFSRLVAMNADGSAAKMISTGETGRSLGYVQDGGTIVEWNVPGKPGHVLATRVYVPERSIGTRLAQTKEGVGVDLLDLTKLDRTPVEQPKDGAVEFIADGQGLVRIYATRASDPSGYARDSITYLYRKAGAKGWDSLVRNVVDDVAHEGEFWPEAIDSAKDVVYGFAQKDGRQALYSLSLDGLGTRQLVLARGEVDVDGLVRIGRSRRVVGASFATEHRMTEFFDPELKKLRAALGKALPGNLSIDFLDASADEGKLLMLASSDTNPGMFYLYTKATRQLEQVLPARSALEGVALGTMKPITYTAADGTRIPGYLTLPPGSSGKGLPAIVMPHGGPGARDEWGFDWLVQYFAVRGFAVIQPNFRGSTGYGADWYQKNGFQSWRTAIGDVNDAGRYLITEGIAAPGKLAIVGWSYGGYAALQGSVLDPDLYKAIVAIAPVTDLERLREDSRAYTSFPQINAFIGHGPHVKQGSPAQSAEVIKAPVLMFHGDKDQNVYIGHSRLMADRLRGAGKRVNLVEFPGLRHSLSTGDARARLLAESDAFLRKELGLPAN